MQENPFQLGLTFQEENVVFRVDIPNGRDCALRLYDSLKNTILREYQLLDEHRVGNVYSITIPEAELIGDGYRYVSWDREFIDPYAKRLLGREKFGEQIDLENLYAALENREFDWEQDQPLQLDYQDLLLYKLHVRGYTMHQSSGVKSKGSYRGIVEKIPYLKELGVNAILLMPCVEFNEILNQENFVYGRPKHRIDYRSTEQEQVKLNFWGYTGDAYYFAPKASYASDPRNCIQEMKEMVKQLHRNGIEVLLDMHFPEDLSPITVLECLRFWKLEYHVDGFCINGAPYREHLIATDPFLSRTKLLSATWDTKRIYRQDVIPQFRNLAEYNDGFLVDVRRFLKADEGQVQKLIHRFKKNATQCATINYLADQNGFTLADLYSYDVKHNEENAENNHDGTDYNYSWNCGAEGMTTKKSILQLRYKMMRNALSILLLSQGTPMLQAGDEFGHSQQGNNNAYCQDNEISWIDWKFKKKNNNFLEFCKSLVELRRTHPVFHNSIELKGLDYIACGCPDISFHGKKAWYPDYTNYSRLISVLLNGEYAAINSKEKDVTCFVICNMHWEAQEFDLPDVGKVKDWELIFTTEEGFINGEPKVLKKSMMMKPRTIALVIERKKH